MRRYLVKILSLLVATSIIYGFSLSASAGIEVKFIEPKKFRDIEMSGLSKKKSIEVVKTQMQKLFNDVATETLGDSENLIVEVTDIDLAGYMDYFFGPERRDMRIIRDTDRYRIEFNYRLMDKNGKLTKEGQAEIKEFLRQEPRKIRQSKFQTVSYMRDDIVDWVKKSLRD